MLTQLVIESIHAKRRLKLCPNTFGNRKFGISVGKDQRKNNEIQFLLIINNIN